MADAKLYVQVQENCIDLVGRIADRGAEYVPAREWMRICFELLEMLKAHKKGIRRATVNTFGYIAKAIGPQVSSLQLPRSPCLACRWIDHPKYVISPLLSVAIKA